MPRNVRNWWIETNIDGRNDTLSGGPRSADGGFDQTIFMRHKGQVVRVAALRGVVDREGKLQLYVTVKQTPTELMGVNTPSLHIETER